jgi:hypothetical protein
MLSPWLRRHRLDPDQGDAMADRAALMIVLVGLVGAGVLLFTPMSDGPYRCSPVAFGSQGRKTVLPDGREDVPVSPRTQNGVEPWLAAHQWREGICNDAARARGMTAVTLIGSSGVLAAGVVAIFGPSPAGRCDAGPRQNNTAP